MSPGGHIALLVIRHLKTRAQSCQDGVLGIIVTGATTTSILPKLYLLDKDETALYNGL